MSIKTLLFRTMRPRRRTVVAAPLAAVFTGIAMVVSLGGNGTALAASDPPFAH